MSIPIKTNCKNPGNVVIRTWMKKKAVFTTIVDFLWSKSVNEAESQVNQNLLQFVLVFFNAVKGELMPVDRSQITWFG